MDHDKFMTKAVERYGDIFITKPINAGPGVLEKYGQEWADALAEYPPQAYLKENKCPECEKPLDGLFSSFSWGIVHGQGQCSCGKVELRLYHYPLKGDNQRFLAFSLCGFPK